VPVPQEGPVTALRNLRDKWENSMKKLRKISADSRPQPPIHKNDFARLARRICGKSIGVVLGGGGARGISHLVNVSTFNLGSTDS
jgi:lysophospholipid hydrolase